MSESNLYLNILKLGSGIEVCTEQKLISSALVLLYSGIDSVSWLASNEEYSTRTTFIDWVEKYLLKAKQLPCTSLDLYAARCGLLHTFTPDSRLSATGEARRLCYAWGNSRTQDLQRTINWVSGHERLVAVHISDLYEAWRLGVKLFVEEIDSDSNRKQAVYEKADKFFSDLSPGIVQEVLKTLDNSAEIEKAEKKEQKDAL